MATDTPSLRNKMAKAKIVKKLDAEIAEAKLAVSELQAERVKAINAHNSVEAEGLSGPELLEVRFHQKKRAIRETKEFLKVITEQHKASKALLAQQRLELENIDIEAAEEMLPILMASNKLPVAERWKSTPVEHLLQHGLAQSVIDKMKSANIDTLGDLAKLKSRPDFTYQDASMTEGDGDKVDASFDDFLTAYSKFTEDMAAAPAAPASE